MDNISTFKTICSICFDDLAGCTESKTAHFCPDKNHTSCCKECMVSYIETLINSAYLGTCPLITCPNASHISDKNHNQESSSDKVVHIGNKKRKLLIYEEWKNAISPELSNKYNQLANSLLAFLCGGCHSLKTLDVGFDYESSTRYLKERFFIKSSSSSIKVDPENSSEVKIDEFVEFTTDLNLFCEGSLLLDELYQKIISIYLPELGSVGDKEAWDIFINILKMVADPERRANMHLRYLRDRPRIKTACCNREHCFKCRIKDFHDGKTCMESTEALDHSVVCCPACAISLTKGDGCNTITCVCGKQFSWSAEKENTEKCLQFLEAYPTDTTLICSLALCTNTITDIETKSFGNGFTGDNNQSLIRESSEQKRQKVVCSQTISRAKAWQIRHRVDVNREMRNWFRKKFWPCPSQCCAILPHLLQQHLSNLSYGFVQGFGGIREEGVREAAEIWRAEHPNEVETFASQSCIAVTSIFPTFFPNPIDRPVAALRLITRKNSKVSCCISDAKLVESAKVWVEKNKDLYNKEAEAFEVRSAKQFLHLYGNIHPSKTKPSYIFSPCATEWCRKTSNSDLTYTNNDVTVERVGSISCYPAAFSNLVSDHCMFKIVIDVAPKTSNWITFGIARKGMVSSSSDGVGRTSNSWGISDDRSSSSSQSILASSGNEVGHFRKLKAGDVLIALVDTMEGWCDVSVNEHEIIQRFEIPPGSAADYCFAMTFANDHKVSILYENIDEKVNDSPGQREGKVLNMEHTKMFNSLKKHIKNILLSAESIEGVQLSSEPQSEEKCSPLITDESKWLNLCSNNHDEAVKNYELLKKVLDPIINSKPKLSDDVAVDSLPSPSWLTWNTLLDGVSWYKENKRKIQIEISTDLANHFYYQYSDDATFIAAFNLIDYYNTKADTDEKRASLAFMQIYESDMQNWYDYNVSLRDPLIDSIHRKCRCLPRHTKNCPKHSK